MADASSPASASATPTPSARFPPLTHRRRRGLHGWQRWGSRSTACRPPARPIPCSVPSPHRPARGRGRALLPNVPTSSTRPAGAAARRVEQAALLCGEWSRRAAGSRASLPWRSSLPARRRAWRRWRRPSSPHGAVARRGTATRVEVSRRRGMTPFVAAAWRSAGGAARLVLLPSAPPLLQSHGPIDGGSAGSMARSTRRRHGLAPSPPAAPPRVTWRRWAVGPGSGVFPRSMVASPSLPVSSPFTRPPPSLSLLPAALLLSGHRQRGVVPAGRGRSCSSFARGAVALDARWGRRGRSARSGCALDLASEAERALRPMRMRFGVSGAVVFTPKCNATRQRVPVAHV
jgi:hypothetical protein